MATCGPYLIQKHLGCGGFSVVKYAIHQTSLERVALKIMSLEYLMEDSKEALTEEMENEKIEKKKEVIFNEISAMSEMDHPHIVKLHEYDFNVEFRDKKGKIKNVCYLALELCERGDLFDWIADTGEFSENLARFFFRQLIDGLEYLHERGLSHRDLKPDNILLTKNFQLKIADFGFVSVNPTNKTNRGTQGYKAPELIQGKEYSGSAADIFSTGVILFIMAYRRAPFVNAVIDDLFYQYLFQDQVDKFWKEQDSVSKKITTSDSFKELVGKMISLEPSDRPTIDGIKESEWYKGDLLTVEELRKEFKRRIAIRDRVQKLRDRHNKKQDTGVVYRSIIDEELDSDEELDIEKELNIDFSKMTLDKYSSDLCRNTRFFIKDTAQNLLKLMYEYQRHFSKPIELSEDK